MAFLDDNVFGQVGQITQTITGTQIYLNIPYVNILSYIPRAAFFLNGVSQTVTPTPSKFQFWFVNGIVSQTQLQVSVVQCSGYAISSFQYSIIYGLAQYLDTNSQDYYTSQVITIYPPDTRIKVSQVSITAISGQNGIRIHLEGSFGQITTSSWSPSIIQHYNLIYFKYLPCPIYCTTCYIQAPYCDGCLSTTYRAGSDCTACQTHKFLIPGQMNCQQCGPYCDSCAGSASNCINCLITTLRINPPQCTTCPSQTFILPAVYNCQCKIDLYQVCATYCNECSAVFTNCTACQSSTLRSGPPNCMTCPSQYFIQSGVNNCQKCAAYCNNCVGVFTSCSNCQASTLRTNPPNCTTCPSQMFILSGVNNCQQCQSYCNNCSGQSNNCTACNSSTGRSVAPSCTTCPPGMFIELLIVNCQQCKPYCNGCLGSSTFCNQCLQSTLRINPPECLTCPDQYHVVSNIQMCQPCLTYCSNCLPYISYCVACSSISSRINPPNCLECPEFMYVNGDTCIQCNIGCATCDEKGCLTCPNQSSYIDSISNQCFACPSHCLSCDQYRCYSCASNCSECDLFSCLKCISVNYYIKNTQCIECPTNCQTCNDLTCLTCVGPRTVYDNTCQCQYPCATCNVNECLTCIQPDYRLSQGDCQYCPSRCIACDTYGNCLQEPQNCLLGILIESQIICTQCKSNYYLESNVCMKCSSQCLECIDQPLNCSICRFQQVMIQQHCYLCESQIGYYSDIQNNTCYTICGDAIIAETEQCDDANSISNDGCSNCNIDIGYSCSDLGCFKIIYPIPTLTQYLTLDSPYNGTKLFQLSYNIPIQAMNIQMKLLLIPSINFTYEIIQVNNQNIQIRINLQQELLNGQIEIIFTNPDLIQSSIGIKQYIQFIISDVSIFVTTNSTEQSISDATDNCVSVILIMLIIMICLAVLFGGLDIFWNLLDLIQTISYLKYINTIKPYYLDEFLNLFGFIQFQNLPLNQFLSTQSFVQSQIDVNDFIDPPELISRDGFTSSTIINIIPILNVLFAGILVYYSAEFIQHQIRKLNTARLVSYINSLRISILIYDLNYYIVTYCDSIYKQWTWSGLIRIFISSANDICFMICLAIYGLQFGNSNIVKIDLSITIFSILFQLAITQIISNISGFQRKTLLLYENKFGALYEGLRFNIWTKHYNIILIFKKILFMMFLVLFYHEPVFQISSIIILQVIQIFYLLSSVPIKDNNERFKQLICEILMLSAEIQLGILVFDDYLILFQYDYRHIYGWICVFSLVLLIITQLCIDACQQYKRYHKKYSNFRKLIRRLRCTNQI